MANVTIYSIHTDPMGYKDKQLKSIAVPPFCHFDSPIAQRFEHPCTWGCSANINFKNHRTYRVYVYWRAFSIMPMRTPNSFFDPEISVWNSRSKSNKKKKKQQQQQQQQQQRQRQRQSDGLKEEPCWSKMKLDSDSTGKNCWMFNWFRMRTLEGCSMTIKGYQWMELKHVNHCIIVG